ncbi:MAG: hypothetical protein DWQ19_10820 [Crenarchaeota archaeon]|nr:MAG: hypothetical protein DWQ19_10820 [Thermoproteota archaeon]
MIRKNEIYVDEWDGNLQISLSDLEKLIPELKNKYGAKSLLSFDAGYNNVSVVIVPSKKKIKK